jgi:hypothetical protein
MRRQQRGGSSSAATAAASGAIGKTYTLNLKIAQTPIILGRPPAAGTPAAATLETARKAVGNISLSSPAPTGITSFISTPKSQIITFSTPSPVTKMEVSVPNRPTVKNIPLFFAPNMGIGTNIYANINKNNVTIMNVSSGSCCLNILGGETGVFTLNVMTA